MKKKPIDMPRFLHEGEEDLQIYSVRRFAGQIWTSEVVREEPTSLEFLQVELYRTESAVPDLRPAGRRVIAQAVKYRAVQ
jgi:hypothetical protein